MLNPSFARRLPTGLVVLLLLAFLAAPASALDLVFETAPPHEVRVTGATAGGEVVVVGVQRVRHEVFTQIESFGVAVPVDASGEAVVTSSVLEAALPDEFPDGWDGWVFSSLYVAVDLTTGATIQEAPPGYPVRDVSPPGTLPEGASLELPLASAEVVLARPGVGHWRGRVVDGGGQDGASGQDGRVIVQIPDLPVSPAEGPPPTALEDGDVLVGIDPQRLILYVGTVAAP